MTTSARLGRWGYDASYHFTGKLDELAIFPGALPPSKVLDHHRAASLG